MDAVAKLNLLGGLQLTNVLGNVQVQAVHIRFSVKLLFLRILLFSLYLSLFFVLSRSLSLSLSLSLSFHKYLADVSAGR